MPVAPVEIPLQKSVMASIIIVMHKLMKDVIVWMLHHSPVVRMYEYAVQASKPVRQEHGEIVIIYDGQMKSVMV